MAAISTSAPAKTILFGEHAVVYGAPAIAVPLKALRVKAIIQPLLASSKSLVFIKGKNTIEQFHIDDLPADNLIKGTFAVFEKETRIRISPFKLTITSKIPIAAGLGSSAAVAVAIIRALGEFSGIKLSKETVSKIAYQSEVIQHGTPSGIDNSVIAYEEPVYFQKGKGITYLPIKKKIHLILADSGERTLTRDVVESVRNCMVRNPSLYQNIFDSIGKITNAAKIALESGHSKQIGELMTQNHTLLQSINVSSPKLDLLIMRANEAGAFGAKLCGGGRGGYMVAISSEENRSKIVEQLHSISPYVFETSVGGE